MNEQLIQSALQMGLKISKVKVHDKGGVRHIFFVKNLKGRVLHNGESLDHEKLKQLFPGASNANH